MFYVHLIGQSQMQRISQLQIHGFYNLKFTDFKYVNVIVDSG